MQIKREHKNKKAVQIARGGRRGKTAGRGGKGQTARAGNKRRPAMRDTIKKIPKLRGHGINRADTVVHFDMKKFVVINLSELNIFENAEVVNVSSLIAKGLVQKRLGKNPSVKILATGEITKKIIVEGCTISLSAKDKIEKAGGEVKMPEVKANPSKEKRDAAKAKSSTKKPAGKKK
jgi:large subunit ribosomal protein L15